jgi:hypothetical protein
MTTAKNMLTPCLTGLVMSAYGLNIPRYSLLVLLLAIAVLLFAGGFKAAYNKAFLDRLLLLSLFAASYYLFATMHDITGIKESIFAFLAITGSYALGFSLHPGGYREIDTTVPLVLVLMVSGYLTFSFLSVYAFFQTSGLIEIVQRSTFSYWDGSEINGPGLGANASLGMCLLPVVLFGRSAGFKGWTYMLAALAISLMCVAGIYINVALQTRTPFIAMAVSLFCGAALYLYSHRAELPRAVWRLALLGLLAGIVGYYLTSRFDLTRFNIFTRFAEEGLESGGRTEAWKTLLASLHQNLVGGRVARLEISYVHNLWLDVIWDAGIVPFIFLVAYHLKHLYCFKRVLLSKLPLPVVLMASGLGVSFFINFMQEPTMSASVPYFAANCFFLGLLLKITENMKSRQVPGGSGQYAEAAGDGGC